MPLNASQYGAFFGAVFAIHSEVLPGFLAKGYVRTERCALR